MQKQTYLENMRNAQSMVDKAAELQKNIMKEMEGMASRLPIAERDLIMGAVKATKDGVSSLDKTALLELQKKLTNLK